MENLKKLDLRFNDVDIINRPETQSIEELFLSGIEQKQLSQHHQFTKILF